MTNGERQTRHDLILALVHGAGGFARCAAELGCDEGTLRAEVSNVARAAHLPPARNKLGALALALIAELGAPEALLRFDARKHGFLLVPEPRGGAGAALGVPANLQRAVSRIGEAFTALEAAHREDSAGGVRVTAAEWAAVRAVAREGMDALAAAVLACARDELSARRGAASVAGAAFGEPLGRKPGGE